MNIFEIGMGRSKGEDMLEDIANQGGNLPIYIVRLQNIYLDEDDGLKRWVYIGGWIAVTNNHDEMVSAVNEFALDQLGESYRLIVEYVAPWDVDDYENHLVTYATRELGRGLVNE